MKQNFRQLKDQENSNAETEAPKKKRTLRPKEKGIVIKKVSNTPKSNRLVTRSRLNVDASRCNKRKKIIDEPPPVEQIEIDPSTISISNFSIAEEFEEETQLSRRKTVGGTVEPSTSDNA